MLGFKTKSDKNIKLLIFRFKNPPASFSLKHLKGSLTIEAALVLPVFLFALISVIMIGEAVRFSGNLNAALLDTGKKLSIYAYAGDKAGLDAGGLIGGKAVSLTLGKSQTLTVLDKEESLPSPAENGKSGLSFIHSTVLGPDQMIDLNAVWRMKIFFPLPGVKGFRVIDRARIRAFTGYDNTRREDRSHEDEEMVFITETGTVYHRDRNCRHLNINIRTVKRSGVGKERNAGGGKYYPCEYCGSGKQDNVYITEDGDRYHSKISCPGLKRTVKTVPLSRVGGRPPCAHCGGG
ncbi:MAG: pilus assembly protein [Lachnospiraceae bacterium]|nr:pilus assembly protein [Lachnospiraceae bacterium]